MVVMGGAVVCFCYDGSFFGCMEEKWVSRFEVKLENGGLHGRGRGGYGNTVVVDDGCFKVVVDRRRESLEGWPR